MLSPALAVILCLAKLVPLVILVILVIMVMSVTLVAGGTTTMLQSRSLESL
jgi:hypothetical protein